jgi:hypothetical protein
MGSRVLSMIRANAAFDLDGTLPLVVNGEANLDRVHVFCRNFRRRGICSLFLEGLPQLLHTDLQRSGSAFLHVLRSAPEADKITSSAGPFYDSVACVDLDTAREISRYARNTWNPEEEYEDDFLYVTFLMKMFFLDADNEDLSSIVQRYKVLGAEAGDPRFDICASFLENDNSRFERALDRLIRNYDEHYKTGMKRDEILEEEWATEGQLFVEGLALVRLAWIHGFYTETNYQFIPSLVIDTQFNGLNPDSWKSPIQ